MSVTALKPRSRRVEPLASEQFEKLLEDLRPRLLAFIAHARPCSIEEAEDLLQDTVVYALTHLKAYDPVTGSDGLLRWMKELAMIIIMRDRRKTAEQPRTIPLVYCLPLSSRPSDALAGEIRSSLRVLPPELYTVVCDHLDGYLQQDIASRNRIHRNTVKNRMELAAETLRCTFPSFRGFLDMRFFNDCAQHAKYTPQNDMARHWKNNHPPERRPARIEDMGDEEGLRPSLLTDLYCPDPYLLGAKRRTDSQIRRKKTAMLRRKAVG